MAPDPAVSTPLEEDHAPQLADPAATAASRRAEIGVDGSGLRGRAAKGALINSAFLAGLNLLGLLKGFIAAALLATTELGVWGALTITLGAFLSLKAAGIADKYIQQGEEDQERAFQRAFTLEVLLASAFAIAMAAAMPLIALAYGQSELLVPGLVLALAIPGAALQAPVWVFYRRMRFAAQRALQAIDPVVSFAITIVLAVAGLGYWSLVIGAVCGAWAAAIAAIAASPYRLALRWDPVTLREYVGFSLPLLVATLCTIALAQSSFLVGEAALGLAGVGAIYLAVSLSFYVNKVDGIVTQTIYPAICAVQDRSAVLLETFLKSNKLGILWGVPFGVGLSLFAADLISFGIGEKWRPAQALLEVLGVVVAVNQVGFNWNAFMQARGETRPIAVAAVATLVVFCAVGLPLLASEGLNGFAIGVAAATAVAIAVRLAYLRRLFPLAAILSNSARAALPGAFGVAVVLAVRAATDLGGGGGALIELALFVAAVVAATAAFERRLIGELLGYVRGAAR
jgi:O-antigen/teichoic acid export membrane protein